MAVVLEVNDMYRMNFQMNQEGRLLQLEKQSGEFQLGIKQCTEKKEIQM